jgi:hypothetical protein
LNGFNRVSPSPDGSTDRLVDGLHAQVLVVDLSGAAAADLGQIQWKLTKQKLRQVLVVDLFGAAAADLGQIQ